jgi:N-succinyldiaminopimelate aminotransferase
LTHFHAGALEWRPLVISKKLKPFGTTVFSEMTRLAIEHDAINLSQGFPDFDGPPDVIEAAIDALRAGHNQYARSMGHPLLVQAIADRQRRLYGLEWDPMREVVVFSGATEGIFSTMMGLLEPGDEVILFEPFYDSYPASAAMAGATAKYLTLSFPDFAIDFDRLRALFTPKTRLLVINTPQNPTGKVFSRAELEGIAALCIERDVLVMTDEVYEHLTYDGVEHVPMASIPGMRERTISISSSGKTFSFTGWKIGWATGPAPMISAAQAAHQFVTFATSTPMQIAIATAMKTHGAEFFDELRASYTRRRDFLIAALREAGFNPSTPKGAYFVLAEFAGVGSGDDVAFVRELVAKHRVAAIPPSAFYAASDEGKKLVRFAFCKKDETLQRAAERLRGLARRS